MHNAAFAALGLDWAYVALPTALDRLEEAVGGLAALGFAGASVTTPHKVSVTGWPPELADADLVINATSERDAVVVELHAGQTLVDLPYPETATAAAARRAGARVVPGLEVLVTQGAAAFELWTGVAAPVDVMRDAIGLDA